MPNWCENSLRLKHENPEMISKIVESLENDKGLFGLFVPIPKELEETPASFSSDEKQENNLKEFGYANWYEFCLDNWGTKWDITETYFDVSDDLKEIFISFDTAWSPPIKFYEKLEKLGFSVDAFYVEYGNLFCGRFTDGTDDYYEIPLTIEETEKLIPSDILDEFNIIENCDDVFKH